MKNIDRSHFPIDTSKVYTGEVLFVRQGENQNGERKRSYAFIEAHDKVLAEQIAKVKRQRGCQQANLDRIQCVLRLDDFDDFFACRDNDYVIKGDTVSFRVCLDKNGFPQARNVKVIKGAVPVSETIASYVDPALTAPLPDCIKAALVEMEAAGDLLDEEDDDETDLTELEEEYDQDELDFGSYYEEN